MSRSYGYIRVSTREQNVDRQRIALNGLNVADMQIFEDRQSGKDFKRPNYMRMIRQLKKDDILYITSIDRLGRNYDEILEQWRIIIKEKSANIVVLDMPLLDTRAKGKDLTGRFVASLVLQILSYVAETERINIRERQAQGIAAAKARGVHFGKRKQQLPAGFEETVKDWRDHKISLKDALLNLGIGKTYFYEHVREMNL